MVDGSGRLINLQRRYRDPGVAKRGMRGGKLGLFVPSGWRERPGPLYVPEGASDVAALFDVGVCAVGRPSNRAGADHLRALLEGDGRDVVVVGENDRKPDGDWPGDPHPCARSLARRLGRPVRVIVPPEGHKDARAWRTAARDDVGVRAALLRLTEQAAPVVPAQDLGTAAPRGGFRVTVPFRSPKSPHAPNDKRHGGTSHE
jgi:hypothetical protein